MCNGVGAVISWHEFGNMGFSVVFAVAAAIFSGKHNEVTNLINVFWCMVFVGMVSLTDFGGKEVVLCLLDIECNPCYYFMSGSLNFVQ